MEWTTDQKGGVAELAIAAEAAQLGIGVLRPVMEGERYDLIFDLGTGLLRVQCKWATRRGAISRRAVPEREAADSDRADRQELRAL